MPLQESYSYLRLLVVYEMKHPSPPLMAYFSSRLTTMAPLQPAASLFNSRYCAGDTRFKTNKWGGKRALEGGPRCNHFHQYLKRWARRLSRILHQPAQHAPSQHSHPPQAPPAPPQPTRPDGTSVPGQSSGSCLYTDHSAKVCLYQ
jgi:hypothetical protein